MLGNGALGALATRATERNQVGWASDLAVLAWLRGALLTAARESRRCGFRRSAASPSRRRRWFVILDLLSGMADTAYWLSARSVRASPLHAYPGHGKPDGSPESLRALAWRSAP